MFMPMHVAVFYQYYHNPDCSNTARHYHLLHRLVLRHRVTLLTTRAWFDQRLTHDFDWVPPGVNLRMFDVPYANTMSTGRRLHAYLHYAVRAAIDGLWVERPDVILGVSTPLTAAWAAAATARVRRVPWVFEVQDLWPDFPVQMGALPNPTLQRLLYRLERWLYCEAAHVVALSPDIATHILRFVPGNRVTALVHGTDFSLLPDPDDRLQERLRTEHGLDGRHVVLYAGTFGRANDIPTLLDAARRIEREDVCFVFAGQGYHAAEIEQAASEYPNIRLIGPQPLPRMLAWFRLADLSLVSFIDRPVLATNSPAKFFDSLSAGTPVIVTNPGWTKAFVEDHGCGWYTPASDSAALARTIEAALADTEALAEAGRRAADVARRNFDRDVLSARLEQILLDAATP